MTPWKNINKRFGWVAVAAIVAALSIPLVASATHDSSPAIADAEFGCDRTTVIANLDCRMGVAAAFDSADDTASGRAPWCGAEADLTIYGCP